MFKGRISVFLIFLLEQFAWRKSCLLLQFCIPNVLWLFIKYHLLPSRIILISVSIRIPKEGLLERRIEPLAKRSWVVREISLNNSSMLIIIFIHIWNIPAFLFLPETHENCAEFILRRFWKDSGLSCWLWNAFIITWSHFFVQILKEVKVLLDRFLSYLLSIDFRSCHDPWCTIVYHDLFLPLCVFNIVAFSYIGLCHIILVCCLIFKWNLRFLYLISCFHKFLLIHGLVTNLPIGLITYVPATCLLKPNVFAKWLFWSCVHWCYKPIV